MHEVAAAGAQVILLNPLFDELNQMHRLATEVIPKLAEINFMQTWRNRAPQE
jgi:hypothetical protein